MSFVSALAATTGFQVGPILHTSATPSVNMMAWPMPGKGGAKKGEGFIGKKAIVAEAPEGIEWARAAWAVAEMPDDGTCYMIDEDSSPEDGKDYFFCSEPSADAKMTCEEMPEFMGTMPDGSKVYICATPKVEL